MEEVFVIMQIGNEQMDYVCDEAIDPAIVDAGYVARRVDRHNQGDLLKSEIVQFIERSQVIVADVTNERPNCYLEIGYAMGLGKKSNLILTAREDHHHSSESFDRNGPKIHFDLEGYSILFWDPDDLPTFRDELSSLIRRRAAIVRPAARPSKNEKESDWQSELRERGEAGLASVGRSGYLEVAAELHPAGTWPQTRLLEVVRDSSIHAFGWPIAVVLDNRDEYRPRPTADGIVAEIAIGESEPNNFQQDRRSYDLWKLFRDGRFYTLVSYFEDERSPGSLFLEVRIKRVTEALLLLSRMYRRLGASDKDQVSVRIRHTGLEGKTLRAASRSRDLRPYESVEDESEVVFTTTLSDLEANLVDHVKSVIDPLFMLFEFFQLSERTLVPIVDEFVAET